MKSNSEKPMRAKILALLLISLLFISTTPVQAQGEGPVYIVEQGDTLYGIARRFGTTVDAILELNAIADSSRIFPGTELTIPGYPWMSGVLGFKVVELGESLDSIARQYSARPGDLARLNRLVRRDSLYAGQAFIVPEPENEGANQVSGSQHLVRQGETRLEMSVRAGTNPWAFSDSDEGRAALWQVAGMLLVDRLSDDVPRNFAGPLQGLTVEPLPLVQGQTTVIKVVTDEPALLNGSLGEHELGFFPEDEQELIALQGIHALAEPGLMTLRLELHDPQTSSTIYAFQQPVLLESGNYGSTVLNGVPAETIDPAVTQPEEAMIAELLAPKSAVKEWQGTFEYPSRYYTDEFIASFGTRRSYNNGALEYYHTGVDFYGNGVPIYAPAPGHVVFAGPLTVRGNVTYIDHGWGVYSGYLHQSEIYVEVGDFVDTGDVIGLVGGTGRVTGPHLHWEIWVGGVPVEPLTWIERSFP
jgi:murein DD-endopeptidase MepM/ murein hydrolase activator NlpD